MSIQGEPIEHELTVEEYLSLILEQLKLLNARFEEANNTNIEEDDL